MAWNNWFSTKPQLVFPLKIVWLVVWNIFYFSIYWECHHPNWLFRGIGLNHQPVVIFQGKVLVTFQGRKSLSLQIPHVPGGCLFIESTGWHRLQAVCQGRNVENITSDSVISPWSSSESVIKMGARMGFCYHLAPRNSRDKSLKSPGHKWSTPPFIRMFHREW